jgi:hypothetical protein
MIWDFVNNRLTQVDSLYDYEIYGLKVVDDSGYLYAKTSPSTMTRFKRKKVDHFVKHGSFSMMDCNLAWFHVIDDYCLALYRHGLMIRIILSSLTKIHSRLLVGLASFIL